VPQPENDLVIAWKEFINLLERSTKDVIPTHCNDLQKEIGNDMARAHPSAKRRHGSPRARSIARSMIMATSTASFIAARSTARFQSMDGPA